jgi:MSHA pilin protein MshB
MKSAYFKQKQQGFTIIELVVVILLLGILTATALPRFMDVTDEAHDAVRDSVLAGLSTSGALFRSQWYAEGQPAIVTEYSSMRANASGFPKGIATNTLDSHADCLAIFETFLQAGGRPSALVSTVATGAALTAVNVSGYAAGTDFVAHRGLGTSCQYAYIGQFPNANTAGANVPVIQYSATTGIFSLGSEL